MRLLAGDVGGTKTLLAIYEGEGEALTETRAERYPSADYDGLEAIVRAFLADDDGAVDRAGFGVAGPTAAGRAEITNLPWVIESGRLGEAAGTDRVALVNDFSAVALGIRSLGPDQLEVLQDAPVDPLGPVAILGAGTGLGRAIVVPQRGGPARVLPTEGGHVDFAPRDEVEIGLLRYLLERNDRVSVEHIVSGPGLASVYEYLVHAGAAAQDPDLGARIDAAEDPSAVIGEAALASTEGCAREAVERWVSLYGSQAGNLALESLPTGGLYVAGGIAPRLLPILQSGTFLNAFLNKEPMRKLLTGFRVSVITEPRVGLLGARNAATDLD